MKKIISIIITISMLLASVPAFAISGTGTESNPYLISSASDIAKIHNDLDGYYKLANNINMSGIAFEPIGNENEGAFTGTIDGAGYTISNLNINLPDNKYVGFVGYLEGTVKNLNLTNVDAYGYRYVGGLVGYAETNSEINNCSVSGKVSGQYQILNLNIGGIVGYSNTNIYGCVSMTDIDVPQYSNNIGGVVGYCNGDIANCSNKGDILFRDSTYVGGISGYCKSITNCLNQGNITQTEVGPRQMYCGGISGYVQYDVTSSNNLGDIYYSTSYENYGGGIVGKSEGNAISCINRGTITLSYSGNNSGFLGGISGSSKYVEYCNNYGIVLGRGYGHRTGGISANANAIYCCNYAPVTTGSGNNGGLFGSVKYSYVGGIVCYGNVNNSINYGEVSTSGSDYTGAKTITYQGTIDSSIDYASGNIGTPKNSVKINGNKMTFYDSFGNVLNRVGSSMFYISSDFINFDFDKVWYVEAKTNSGFPTLRDMPRHIDLSESAIIMRVGDTDSLYAYIDSISESVTWTSDNSSIATITSNGTITAKSIGTCTITATNSEGMKTNCLICVYGKATSMQLSASEVNLNKGKTYTLTTIQSPNTANEAVRWYSENEDVATVDQYGTVTAKGKGTTIIYAITSQSRIRAECAVNVSAPITSISLSTTSKNIKVGSSDVIAATLSPSDYEGNITWSSSDESIASVEQNGKITAHKIGTAHITATAPSGATAQCTVTVNQPSTSVIMNKPNITAYVNATYQLSASMLPLDTTDTITWSSSSTTYATVSNTGLVTGKRTGTATITATTSSGLKATCYVTVKAVPIEPTSITLSETYVTLAPEDAKALTATLLPSNATETTLTWTSSNDDVATVDKNGVVTAIGEGFATIKAKTTNGLSHECVVKVVSASGPSVIVDNVKSFPAGIAKTKVNIIRNPGISGYKFTIKYDEALLTPVSVTANKEFRGTLTTNLDDENRTGFNVVWYSNSDTDIDINGELFTIDFKVAETAEPGDYSDISIEYGAKDICNTAGENIALYTESAKVTVEEPLPGDIYEDGDVNIYDLTLLARHMIGLADFTDRQLEAANVTADELVDIKDVVKLAQYVVGWTGIELMSLMSLSAEIPETPIVTVGTASVNDANEADIPVYIKNNTGIAAYRFVLDYNADDIEIVSITPSDFINPENFGTNLGQENDEGLIVFCYQEGNAAADGELFTVKVRYKNPTDTSVSPISIKSAENNFCNQAIENVAVNYETGYALGDDYIVANKVVSDTNFSCELYFDDSYAEQSAKAIIAFYDGDGRMIQLMPKDITAKPGKVYLSIDYDKKAYATYKLMIWEGMGNLKPITEVK